MNRIPKNVFRAGAIETFVEQRGVGERIDALFLESVGLVIFQKRFFAKINIGFVNRDVRIRSPAVW